VACDQSEVLVAELTLASFNVKLKPYKGEKIFIFIFLTAATSNI
jgi:hypothetical protein